MKFSYMAVNFYYDSRKKKWISLELEFPIHLSVNSIVQRSFFFIDSTTVSSNNKNSFVPTQKRRRRRRSDYSVIVTAINKNKRLL